MQRLHRLDLPANILTRLEQEQSLVIDQHSAGTLDIDKQWKSVRQTKTLTSVLAVLQRMTGVRERCMYCVDSHGSDIEHFRPKKIYPEHAFQWPNMLLCCTECGRFKGSQFPIARGQPLLIDPSSEDPWQHLDFDPDTGNLTARFHVPLDAWSERGSTTVSVLKLDQREAVAAGYQRGFRRLADIVRTQLDTGTVQAQSLFDTLSQADDHGLLGWCFGDTGKTIAPFLELCQRHPAEWDFCRHLL